MDSIFTQRPLTVLVSTGFLFESTTIQVFVGCILYLFLRVNLNASYNMNCSSSTDEANKATSSAHVAYSKGRVFPDHAAHLLLLVSISKIDCTNFQT